jgi:hypothetical protein
MLEIAPTRLRCHPERSRISGGAKDLSLSCFVGVQILGMERPQ